MNVKKLKELIKDLDDNLPVLLQIDNEGSGYKPLYYVDPNCITECADGYFIETVYSTGWSYEEAGMEDEEEWEEFKKNTSKCLVLAP